MERKNANIDDVIRTVETASAKELEELAGMGLKKGFCQQLHPQSLVQARELEIQ